MAAVPAFKAAPALSMVDGCLTSLPAHFTKACHPFLPLPVGPLRLLRLSSSSSSSSLPLLKALLLRRKAPPAPLVARTSNWARQEEFRAGEEGEESQGEGEEAGFSEWEGEVKNQVGRITDWEEGEQTEAEGAVGGSVAGFSEWEEEVEEVAAVGAVAERVDEEEGEEAAAEGEFYPELPEEAKLFVGNLPYDMDSEKLAQLFDQAGVVEVAEVIYNRETDQSRGFGFVTMSTVEEAEKAIETFSRHYVEGRLLTVNKAAPRGSRPERAPRESSPRFRIYVGNLPWSVDDARLEQVFSEYGKVVDGRVVYDRETGRSRGFGFVTMSVQREMDDAIAALDGQNLDGRTIRVNAAEERPRRVSF